MEPARSTQPHSHLLSASLQAPCSNEVIVSLLFTTQHSQPRTKGVANLTQLSRYSILYTRCTHLTSLSLHLRWSQCNFQHRYMPDSIPGRYTTVLALLSESQILQQWPHCRGIGLTVIYAPPVHSTPDGKVVCGDDSASIFKVQKGKYKEQSKCQGKTPLCCPYTKECVEGQPPLGVGPNDDDWKCTRGTKGSSKCDESGLYAWHCDMGRWVRPRPCHESVSDNPPTSVRNTHHDCCS